METGDYVSTRDLINLTFNQACHTLIRDVSDMESVGKEYVLSSREGIALRELRELDLEKIGRELLSSGGGIPTSYGLLFRNEGVKFEEIYNGKGFPAYYHTGAEALGVEIENDGEKDYIYFPCEKTETDRALKRIVANDISDCIKRIDYTSGGKEWEAMLNAVSSESEENFDDARAEQLINEKRELERQLTEIKERERHRERLQERLDDIYVVLDGLKNRTLGYDDKLVRQVIERVVVESKEKIRIVFVAGTEMEESL